MNLTISPEFQEFLKLLSEKKEGSPFAHYQESLDFLTVLFGNGDCRNYMLGGIIATGADVLLRRHPEEFRGEFVGIEIWGGVQGLLSKHFQLKHGKSYAKFSGRHNVMKDTFPLRMILDLICASFGKEPLWGKYAEQIEHFLQVQAPRVHIPLLPLCNLHEIH